MRTARLTATLCALALLPGCLTLYSKTEVVRSDETRTPVAFESQEAAYEFNKAVAKRSRIVGATDVSVPFLTLYERQQVLADAAAWNDAVAKCDTDQNGLITRAEAAVFAK